MKNFSLSSITRFFSYGPTIKPGRDWIVLLSVFFLALILSVVWNVVLFSRVTSGQTISSAPASVQKAPQKQSIQTLFTARAGEHDKYVSSYTFVDPSL